MIEHIENELKTILRNTTKDFVGKPMSKESIKHIVDLSIKNIKEYLYHFGGLAKDFYYDTETNVIHGTILSPQIKEKIHIDYSFKIN